jgi:hypothetical protein
MLEGVGSIIRTGGLAEAQAGRLAKSGTTLAGGVYFVRPRTDSPNETWLRLVRLTPVSPSRW